MYVCVCKAVTEQQLLCALSDGDNSLELLHNRFTIGEKCGKCIAAIEKLITDHKNTDDGLPTLQTFAPIR